MGLDCALDERDCVGLPSCEGCQDPSRTQDGGRLAVATAVQGLFMSEYFTSGCFKFLRDLKRHNDREWFAANRERYAADVEGRCSRSSAISASACAGSARVCRRSPPDWRLDVPDLSRHAVFSRQVAVQDDVAARFPHEARRKVEGVPSFYLSLAPGECAGGGGVYHTAMPVLTRLRRQMVDQPARWQAVLDSGIEVEGEQLKRAPAGFDANHRFVEDLKRKDLYSLVEFTEQDVTVADFLDRFTDCARAWRR